MDPDSPVLTDPERIQRLEHVLGTLISWLQGPTGLSGEVANELRKMLREAPPAPPISRKSK